MTPSSVGPVGRTPGRDQFFRRSEDAGRWPAATTRRAGIDERRALAGPFRAVVATRANTGAAGSR